MSLSKAGDWRFDMFIPERVCTHPIEKLNIYRPIEGGSIPENFEKLAISTLAAGTYTFGAPLIPTCQSVIYGFYNK